MPACTRRRQPIRLRFKGVSERDGHWGGDWRIEPALPPDRGGAALIHCGERSVGINEAAVEHRLVRHIVWSLVEIAKAPTFQPDGGSECGGWRSVSVWQRRHWDVAARTAPATLSFKHRRPTRRRSAACLMRGRASHRRCSVRAGGAVAWGTPAVADAGRDVPSRDGGNAGADGAAGATCAFIGGQGSGGQTGTAPVAITPEPSPLLEACAAPPVLSAALQLAPIDPAQHYVRCGTYGPERGWHLALSPGGRYLSRTDGGRNRSVD